jgi:plastocyanin
VTWGALALVVALAATPITLDTSERYRVVKVVAYGEHHHKTKRACKRHGDRHCRRHVVWRRVRRPDRKPAPGPPPNPSATPTPTPTATPTPPPELLPSRTGVDLDEWRVTPSYRELRAGEVEFNAANLGEDDHDFSVRDANGTNLTTTALSPGGTATVRLTLVPAVYTLYCSLPDHEELGMKSKVTVR